MPTRQKLEREAARCNGVWTHWRQHNYLLGRVFGRGGVCSPLSIVFLKLQATGEGHFNTYVTSDEGRDVVMWLKEQQHGNAVNLYAMQYLGAFGLRRAFSQDNCSETAMLNYIKLKGYYLLGISSLHGYFANEASAIQYIEEHYISAHALAVVNDSPRFMFFDPNFGAGAFRNANDMATFVQRYWKNVYQDMRGSASLERYFKA